MDIFSFGVHFTDEKVVAYILKNSEIKKEWYAIDGDLPSIIGFKTNGVTSVSLVRQGFLCVVVLSWRVLNYHL